MEPKQVVVAHDFSEAADTALDRAVELACRAPQHVLHFVHAIGPGRGDWRDAEQLHERLLERIGAIFAHRAPEHGIEFFVHVRIGDPVEEILGLAEDVGADLLILGSRARGDGRRLLLGSTIEGVVRDARCPVVIARPKEYRRVELAKVVRVDGPRRSRWIAPRRYSYASAALQLRPDAFPIH